MPSSLLGAHPAAASGGETPDETKPDKEGWDKPGDEGLSFKDRTTLRSTNYYPCDETHRVQTSQKGCKTRLPALAVAS